MQLRMSSSFSSSRKPETARLTKPRSMQSFPPERNFARKPARLLRFWCLRRGRENVIILLVVGTFSVG
jgi:hypothetical protein